MTIEENIFRKIKISEEKLKSFGFKKKGKEYYFEKDFLDGEFRAELAVDKELKLNGKVIEKSVGDEYLPLRVKSAGGSFVNEVRKAYEEVLKDVAMNVGIPVPFVTEQANRIALAVVEKYGEAPDFPWKDEGDFDDGVFRHGENEKWFALIMYTAKKNLKTAEEKAEEKKLAEKEKKRRALERKKREEAKKAGKKLPQIKRKKTEPVAPLKEDEKINIMNLKIRKEDAEMAVKEKWIYPSYHMSQKTWISVPLNDSLSDARIMDLVDTSYRLTQKKAGGAGRRDGKKVWLIPSNPKYYDIVGVFGENDDTVWKQGKGIETGDTVYMYVGAPYSAVMFRCTVTEAYSGTEWGMTIMDLHVEERYDADLCTLDKMKNFHVTTVRGPRFMPEELEEFIRRESGGSKK